VTQPIGTLLPDWRAARRIRQVDSALEVGVLARHLSCIETGKPARRDRLARFADAFDMPQRWRNALRS